MMAGTKTEVPMPESADPVAMLAMANQKPRTRKEGSEDEAEFDDFDPIPREAHANLISSEAATEIARNVSPAKATTEALICWERC